MALGYETAIVNSQMVNVAPGQAFAPLTFGSTYTGPGMWPRNGVYNVPPVTPSPGTWAGTDSDVSMSGGGHPAPSASAMTSSGGVNFFSPTKSPLLMALFFLAAGLGMLHFIHYK